MATSLAPLSFASRLECGIGEFATVQARRRLGTLNTGQRWTLVVIVLAARLHERAQILTELLERRSPDEPPPIIDRVNRQVRGQREGIGKCDQAVFEIGRCHFDHIELPDGLTLMVTEEGEGSAESGSEGRAHFCRVRTDDGKLTVVDLQILLQFEEAPHLARAFRSPIAAVKAQDQRKATGEFGQRHGLMPMIRERQVWESPAHNEIGMHSISFRGHEHGP
jgi:hypothetical protein